MEKTPGLYDELITTLRKKEISELENVEIENLSEGEIPIRLGEFFGKQIEKHLEKLDPRERKKEAISISKLISHEITRQFELIPSDPLQLLKAIEPEGQDLKEPLLSLRDTTLITNSPTTPRLGSHLRKETDSADQVDIIIAFIFFTGIRSFLEPLKELIGRGKQVRIITTTYQGQTELRALQELEKIGAEIKVSYDTKKTRLHAKAWMFHRNTGYSTVYIGSSNISYSDSEIII